MAATAAIGARTLQGRHMVILVFILLNCSLGVNFAAYGALVDAIETSFATTRALAAAGLSMLTLALGLLSPLVGGLMRRTSIRTLMLAGITLNALGYLLLTQVDRIGFMLAVYMLMIGPGFALSGPVPCTAVIANWFDGGRGKALGIVNMPIGNTLMPLLAAALLATYGLRATFLGEALLLLAMLPLAWLIVDHPDQKPERRDAVDDANPPQDHPMTARQILRSPPFLLLTIGVSLLSAAGLVMVTHIVALAIDRGIALAPASLLLSAFGFAGVIGAPLFGWIADRVGGGRAFALLALVQIPAWLGLIGAGASLPILLCLAFAIGLCSNAILPLFGSTMGSWLGSANVGLGMGLCYLLQIPFMFGAGPLAGAMFDHFGSYAPTILLHVATFAAIGLLFLLYRPRPAV
ncbi:MFS transporter [Sphingobium sp.]|uniref:MFS transporter n=1 Tax=Sphingobium sp. TaxID=1912891 RepID=UPI00260E2608|nr:MFS transporter [Sphingobium sp.]